MAVLTWDETGKKFYETGVDRGVLFPVNPATGAYSKGVAWSGLTNVTETPSGAEQTDLYADNIKYLSLTRRRRSRVRSRPTPTRTSGSSVTARLLSIRSSSVSRSAPPSAWLTAPSRVTTSRRTTTATSCTFCTVWLPPPRSGPTVRSTTPLRRSPSRGPSRAPR